MRQMQAEYGGLEPDGEGFSVMGPDGQHRFEETPQDATAAWRRSLARSAQMRRN